MPVSFVTPSTRPAISSPNASRTSSSDALVSSTVSCRSAAHSVSVSRRMPAQIFATPTGWVMKSSPDWRRWSAWCSQAKTKASPTRWRSTLRTTSSACSSTMAKRSASSARSIAVRSGGASVGAACGWSWRSTGVWPETDDRLVREVQGRPAAVAVGGRVDRGLLVLIAHACPGGKGSPGRCRRARGRGRPWSAAGDGRGRGASRDGARLLAGGASAAGLRSAASAGVGRGTWRAGSTGAGRCSMPSSRRRR